MRFRFSLLLLPGVLGIAAGGWVYKLDLKAPADLVFTYPYRSSLPAKVDVYRTGLRVGPDKWETPEGLSQNTPVLSVTNEYAVKELISALRHHDDASRISNVTSHKGYTYHLLLFNEDAKTLMHFRVFQFADTNTIWADVWPRSDTGFAYFNKEILPWLKSHIELESELNSTRQPQHSGCQ